MKRLLKHPIYAQATDSAVIVYQAYNAEIGKRAAQRGTLDVPGFSTSRMTWIKPSFLWMMYRCGWGRKDANQETVLRIALDRRVFREVLEAACLSSFDPSVYADSEVWKDDLGQHPNRVQWDPDRDIYLAPKERRAIQVGISAAYVGRYLDGIIDIQDVTADAQMIEEQVQAGHADAAIARLPQEDEIVL